jgi:hypothetical protein
MTPSPAPSSAPSSPPPARAVSGLGARERLARWIFAAAAALLAFLAAAHAASYVTVAIALGNSGLQPSLRAAIRAQWLGYALELLVVAAVVGLAAWRPRGVSPAVLVLAGLLALLQAALMLAYSGGFYGSLALLACGTLVILGALVRPSSAAV